MAVYKVIQDVEAEDKLLGPLSFKAFIYALIAGTCAFIEFEFAVKVGLVPLKLVLMVVVLFPLILFGVLASPLGREQPTEVWLLSRIKFFLKPRQRIWDQSGMMDLVTVTVPKKQDLHLTKELSPDEVQSRLKTLASTLDTRGWAIKNVDVNMSVPEVEAKNIPQSDRLVGTAGVPQQMPVADVHAADDILDEKHNPTAQKFETLMQKAEEDRKHSLLSSLKGLAHSDEEPHEKHKKEKRHKEIEKKGAKFKTERTTKDLPATRQALSQMKKESAAEKARRKAEEDARIERELIKARESFSAEFENGQHKADPHHHIFTPRQQIATAPTPTPVTANPVTAARQADNMELAQSGSAFSVSALSQLANRPVGNQQTGSGEVNVSLH
ncbi:PrgI family protein [Candidatus Saccharibacteria bacterium]|nr:PrgI family protein [Candidatus Saccharibacteria bacterium]